MICCKFDCEYNFCQHGTEKKKTRCRQMCCTFKSRCVEIVIVLNEYER